MQNLDTDLISDHASLIALVAELKKEKWLAVDTEFIRESTFFPQMEIIQIGTRTRTFLIDARAFSDQASEAVIALKDLMRDQGVVKIFHAAQGDQECFYHGLGFTASPCLDTAVAASLCGYGDSIGLGNLLKAVLGVELKKGHARTNWGVRPLPDQLMEYARLDVAYLVEATEILLQKCEQIGRRQWAFDLSRRFEDEAQYDISADALAERLGRGARLDVKGQAVLIELMRWREARVRKLNVPRRWVAEDVVLVDLARTRPKDVAHLSAFRGLNKGELKNSGNALLECIRKGEAAQAPGWERSERMQAPSQSESQILELMKTYVGLLADHHRIAIKHLFTVAQGLPLLRSQVTSPQQWVEQGLISQSACDLIGGELLALVQGKRALKIDQGKVAITEIG